MEQMQDQASHFRAYTGRVSHDRMNMVILHDDRLFREALADALCSRTNLVASCHSSDEMAQLAAIEDAPPDVVVVDFANPLRSRLNLVRRLHCIWPRSRILAIGCKPIPSDIVACIECGCAGVADSDCDFEELVDVITRLRKGSTACSHASTSAVLDYMRRGRRPGVPGAHHLTPRELDVLKQIQAGKTNKEIAAALGVRPHTVKNHVHHILEKTLEHRREDAVRFALERGLLPPLEPSPPGNPAARGMSRTHGDS